MKNQSSTILLKVKKTLYLVVLTLGLIVFNFFSFKAEAQTTVKALVIGGGGGAGGTNSPGNYNGGGGAGGYRYETTFAVTAQAYSITVGTGGAGGGTAQANGTNGNNSVFSTITAYGGGGGGYGKQGGEPGGNGANGGCGGGGGAATTVGAGGTGSQGGNGAGGASSGNGGGGGGAGGNAANDGSATGGIGTANSISGTSVTYAVGGNGGVKGTSKGSYYGEGGHGNFPSGGESGNAGIVIIRYLASDFGNCTVSGTGNTIASAIDDANYKVATFIVSGTFTVVAAPPVPTTQASYVTFSSVQSCGMTVGWTRPASGGGSNCAVFMNAGSTGTAVPVDGTTYTANTIFGSGTPQAGTGWYCIYNGTGTSVAVTGLSAGTTYRVHVCEYNGSAGSEKYLNNTATDNPNNQAATAMSYGTVGSGNQTICNGATPASMSVSGATGSTSFAYQWYSQSGIVSCPSGSTIGTWTTLGSSNGANTATYTPASGITASTTYACYVTPGGSPSCGSTTWASGCRQVSTSSPTPATVDWNNSNVQEITLATCRSFTFTNGKSGGIYTLIIKQDGAGGRTVTWPENVEWDGGAAPALSTAANAVGLVKFIFDGTNYLGYAPALNIHH